MSILYNTLLNYLCCVIKPPTISTPHADVITSSSAHSKKGLPYLLILAAQNPRVDVNSRGFLTSTGIHSVLNAIQVFIYYLWSQWHQLITSVYTVGFLLHTEFSLSIQHNILHPLHSENRHSLN